ncbi:hypothetical protein ABI59_07950 [Acidobacteria bacterium Mor1]|nr:hypothetical protein ABI59_07950 [Acidobacteria bacterium Mor1]
MPAIQAIDEKRALDHLMKLLALPGPSGGEAKVSEYVRNALIKAGYPKSGIKNDKAHKKIGRGFEIGNLIAKLPGRGSKKKDPRLLFMGHMDTVPLCKGAVPLRKGKRIVSKGNTALGGDNRTSIGALLALAETLAACDLPHPPITLLCTVGEENGLFGALHVNVKDLGNPAMGFNVDSDIPGQIVIGAIGADRWEVDVRGISSHAGVHPDHGVSATLIASRAIADVSERGYFGKITVGRGGASNIGTIQGGEATNQVTDHIFIKGESRSHNKAFLGKITKEYEKAFQRAAKSVRNHKGKPGKIEFRSERDYDAFRMSKNAPPVKFAAAAAKRLGLPVSTLIADGGIDASYLNSKGVPTVTLGAGQHAAHTVDEYIEIREYLDGCQLLTEIALG